MARGMSPGEAKRRANLAREGKKRAQLRHVFTRQVVIPMRGEHIEIKVDGEVAGILAGYTIAKLRELGEHDKRPPKKLPKRRIMAGEDFRLEMRKRALILRTQGREAFEARCELVSVRR